MNRVLVVACVALAACAGNGFMEETSTNARPMEGGAGVAYGDCVEANRRASAQPDIDVDSVPRPVSQRPVPFANMPDSVRRQINARGSSVKVNVVVDTLGRPVMKSFAVLESTHPWLAQSLRQAIPSWRFRAARLAGCKVARVYRFSATSRPRG